MPPKENNSSSRRVPSRRTPKEKNPAVEPTLGEVSNTTFRPEEQSLPASNDNASSASVQSGRSSRQSFRRRQRTPDTTQQSLLSLVDVLQRRITSLEQETRPENQARRATTTPSEDRRPIRIPDPERLSDGQTEGPSYESWISALKDKLDYDVFAGGEKEKMAYIFSRTTGKAQDQLQPSYDRSLPDEERYQSVDEMLKDLNAAFVDPYKKQNAVHQYHRLQMRPTQHFREFYQEFRMLAATGNIHQDARQIDLFEKLHYDLKMLVAPTLGLYHNVSSLADQCLLMDQHLRRMQTTRNQELRRRAQLAPTAEPPKRAAFADTPTPTSRPYAEPKRLEYIPTPRPVHTDAQPLKCYNCGKEGHMVKDCREPRRQAIHEFDEMVEKEDDNDSGKEEA